MAVVEKTNPAAQASTEEAGKRGRKPREEYPGLKDGVLKAIPEDYDSSKHAPLQKSNFETKALFWGWKAGVLEEKAEQIAADAKEAKHFATYCAENDDKEPKSKRSIGKALVRQLEMMESIRDELGEIEGMDLDAFLAAAKTMAKG